MNALKEYYKLFPPLWDEYEPGEFLGSGSFGDVYELKSIGTDEKAAQVMKEIVVPPASAGGMDEALFQGLDMEGAKFYYAGMKKKALDEVRIMQQFSDCPNIVQMKDYVVKELPENSGEFGWVIFVRMELLQSLKTKVLKNKMTLQEVAQLGCDLCSALEVCHEKQILHRDVKPENIFYAEKTKTFKLGDFGIACYMSRLTEEKGLPGTLTHMAPEVYHGKPFDYSSDLYAVGMILYKLLNENRVPFLPDYPEKYSPVMRNQAIRRRLDGESIPQPAILRKKDAEEWLVLKRNGASEEEIEKLAAIAVKAIDPEPEKRYSSPTILKNELMKIVQ